MPHSDFDIDSLAKHLHITPQQVSRLAAKGKLPARKIAGEWQFSRSEIHHWMEDRIGLSNEGELLEVEEVLERSAAASDEEVSITKLMSIEAISMPLAARTRSSVIRTMVELGAKTGYLWDPDKMIEAVRSREEMHPTALENGVAMLHPRRPMSSILGEAIVALGRTSKGIPFGGSRGTLTDIFFLICSIDDRSHLRLLARLSRIITQEGFIDMLREVDSPAEAHKLIGDVEKNL